MAANIPRDPANILDPANISSSIYRTLDIWIFAAKWLELAIFAEPLKIFAAIWLKIFAAFPQISLACDWLLEKRAI